MNSFAAAIPLVIIPLIAGIASALLGEVTEAVLIAGIVLLSSGIVEVRNRSLRVRARCGYVAS
jgi:hypothetical protein